MGDIIKDILHKILEGEYPGKVLQEGRNFDLGEYFNILLLELPVFEYSLYIGSLLRNVQYSVLD